MKASVYNEKELLLRISDGDEAAFRIVFDHYQAYIYTAAFKLTRSSGVSEEIVQDVFLKIWVKRNMLPEIAFFPAFLYKVAENIIYPALRTLNKEYRQLQGIQEHKQANDTETEDRLLQKEYDQLLETAIARLPEKQQQAYLLIKREGLKREEAAARLQVSPETVKSNLDQAMRSIRAYCLAHLELAAGIILLIHR